MILAKARVIDGRNGTVRIGLTFPTGFDPDEVIKESVRVDGQDAPEEVSVKPRRGNLNDIYREFELSIPKRTYEGSPDAASLEITGRMRRGLKFSAILPRVAALAAKIEPTDH